MAATFEATIEPVHHVTSKARVRTHTVLVDRGVAKGGLDLGPAGGEYMLVALGGCFTSHLLAAAAARNVVWTGVAVKVVATMGGSPERFTDFAMDVSADCEQPETVRKLIAIAGRACQVVNTLRQAAPIAISYKGVPIELRADITA